MLVTVKAKKLVLGRTVYHKGDVFECRDAEAKLLKAGGMLEKDDPKVQKPTKESPKPPSTGVSVTNKPAKSTQPERAGRPTPGELEALEQAKRGKETRADALKRTVEAAKRHNAQQESAEQEKNKEDSAVGAMTMPQGAAVVTGEPVGGAPSNATPALVPNTGTTTNKG